MALICALRPELEKRHLLRAAAEGGLISPSIYPDLQNRGDLGRERHQVAEAAAIAPLEFNQARLEQGPKPAKHHFAETLAARPPRFRAAGARGSQRQ